METEKIILSELDVAEIDLIYKSKVPAAQRPSAGNSRDASIILRHLWDIDKIDLLEVFKILLLDNSNKIIGMYQVSTGTTNAVQVEVKFIILAAIKANATSIILAHNHPSGNLTPSEDDIQITTIISKAAKLFKLTVVDHIILTSNHYFSFADENLL